MKLELKNIAPYLPYGLPCKYIDEDKLYTLNAEITETNQDKRLLQLFHVLENPSSCKIILRPLSDLTKEIEVDGEKFVPYIELLRECNFDVDNMSIEDVEYYKPKKDEYSMILGRMYFEVAKLFEWHFDVFDLIPSGLAIDINTLQS